MFNFWKIEKNLQENICTSSGLGAYILFFIKGYITNLKDLFRDIIETQVRTPIRIKISKNCL